MRSGTRSGDGGSEGVGSGVAKVILRLVDRARSPILDSGGSAREPFSTSTD